MPPHPAGEVAAFVAPHQFAPEIGAPRQCERCGMPLRAHQVWATTPQARLEWAVAELRALRCEIKSSIGDMQGLMYDRQLRLLPHVATADTNGPGEEADDRLQTVRGHIAAALDFLEHLPARTPSASAERIAAKLLAATRSQRRMLALAVQGVPTAAISELSGIPEDDVAHQVNEMIKHLGVTGLTDPALETELVMNALGRLNQHG